MASMDSPAGRGAGRSHATGTAFAPVNLPLARAVARPPCPGLPGGQLSVAGSRGPAVARAPSGGAVDEAALRALARWQLEQGTDGLVPCGTTGEGATLTADEADRVVRICVEEARAHGKGAPVIAGVGTN